jgi:hypothetical protein
VVTCAKEEEGRIRERKSRVEENGRALEHAQEGLDRCLERILICNRKEVRRKRMTVKLRAIKLM